MMEESEENDSVREDQHLDGALVESHQNLRPSVKQDSVQSSEDKSSSQHSFQIRPQADAKFRPADVKNVLDEVLSETLAGKKYSDESAEKWSKSIANTVRNRIKDREFKRYKLLVQVILGEKHGAGIKVGARCLWDADTDNYVNSSYINETIFCVVTVFAVYMY